MDYCFQLDQIFQINIPILVGRILFYSPLFSIVKSYENFYYSTIYPIQTWVSGHWLLSILFRILRPWLEKLIFENLLKNKIIEILTHIFLSIKTIYLLINLKNSILIIKKFVSKIYFKIIKTQIKSKSLVKKSFSSIFFV